MTDAVTDELFAGDGVASLWDRREDPLTGAAHQAMPEVISRIMNVLQG